MNGFPAIWGMKPEDCDGENIVGSIEMIRTGEPRIRIAVWPEHGRGRHPYFFVSPARLKAMIEDIDLALADEDGSAEQIAVAGEIFPIRQIEALGRVLNGLAEQLREAGLD